LPSFNDMQKTGADEAHHRVVVPLVLTAVSVRHLLPSPAGTCMEMRAPAGQTCLSACVLMFNRARYTRAEKV